MIGIRIVVMMVVVCTAIFTLISMMLVGNLVSVRNKRTATVRIIVPTPPLRVAEV